MTERSYFWDGYTNIVGHALDSPYDNVEFEKIFGLLSTFDPAHQGMIRVWWRLPTDDIDAFLLSNTYGSMTLTIGAGHAVIDNAFYESDAEISYTLSHPSSGLYYYRLVLRKDNGAHTIRQVMLGPNVAGYPAYIQNDAIWDLPIGEFLIQQSALGIWYIGGSIIESHYIHPEGSKILPIIGRLGGSATDWSSPGTTSQAVALNATMQTGVALWTGTNIADSVDVVFPFPFDYPPIVFVSNTDTGSCEDWRTSQLIVAASLVTANGFRINWKSILGLAHTELNLVWMAFGPKAVR